MSPVSFSFKTTILVSVLASSPPVRPERRHSGAVIATRSRLPTLVHLSKHRRRRGVRTRAWPRRDSSRRPCRSITNLSARGPSVEMSLDAARMSACATLQDSFSCLAYSKVNSVGLGCRRRQGRRRPGEP